MALAVALLHLQRPSCLAHASISHHHHHTHTLIELRPQRPAALRSAPTHASHHLRLPDTPTGPADASVHELGDIRATSTCRGARGARNGSGRRRPGPGKDTRNLDPSKSRLLFSAVCSRSAITIDHRNKRLSSYSLTEVSKKQELVVSCRWRSLTSHGSNTAKVREKVMLMQERER